jgi:hypothetical protein
MVEQESWSICDSNPSLITHGLLLARPYCEQLEVVLLRTYYGRESLAKPYCATVMARQEEKKIE